jgi:high-affinity iron transporter
MMPRFALALALLLAILPARAAQPEGERPDLTAIARDLTQKGDALLAAYDPTAGRITADAVSDLYFDVFEGSGMEQAIGLASPARKTELEALFGEIIGKSGQGRPRAEIDGSWTQLKLGLIEIAAHPPETVSPYSVFLQSLLILLREGFEALLVVTALVAWLRRSGQSERIAVIWHGVGLAVLCSLAAAWGLDRVLHLSGADQEIMEGLILIAAALVLFHVSFWLLSKREAAAWQAYIHQQVDRAAGGGHLWTLGLAAFLAVFREGAETVLFYQALSLSAPGQGPALLTGLAAGLVALIGLFLIMRSVSLRLPLGLFFGATAALLFGLAVSFAGQGVLELQEGRWLPITPLDGVPRIGWLGLFPTAEGVTAQAILVVPMLAALGWSALRRRTGR